MGEVPQSFRVVPNKPALVFQDRFLYPEFILLRLLEQAGWSGVWVKNWHGRAFWADTNTPVSLLLRLDCWRPSSTAQAVTAAGAGVLSLLRTGCCADIHPSVRLTPSPRHADTPRV